MSTTALKTVLRHTCQFIVLLTISLPFTWGQPNLLPSNFNPAQQFCFRWGHQSAIIDNRLYIDGGFLGLNSLDSTGTRDNTSYAYPDISYHELTTTSRNGTEIGQPPLVTNLRPKPATAPHVGQGTLWPDTVNKKLYLYGGQATYDGEGPPPTDIWMYDAAYDNWEVMNNTDGNGNPVRLFRGASAVAENLGLAYYLGGWVDNKSQPGWEGNNTMIAGLLIYDMVQNTWRNETIPDNVARAEGSMVYVPIGDSGALVFFGGVKSPDGSLSELVGVSMQEIHIYDIATSKWYLQYAGGRVPSSRRQICADVSTTRGRDGSPVYNIYMYGGASGRYNETIQSGWDQVYVLSLPSFVWTRYWPSGGSNPRPRYAHTCNIFNNAQMLIVGGYFPLGGQCDASNQAGVHNLNLGGSEAAGTVWTDFEPSKTDYVIPADVQQSTEGVNPNWTHPDLPKIFAKTPQQAARTPTRALPAATATETPPPSPPPPSSTGSSSRKTIIALAVAIPVALIIVGIIVFMLYRRRKRLQKANPYPELPKSAFTNSAFSSPSDFYNTDSTNDYKELQRPTSVNLQTGLIPDENGSALGLGTLTNPSHGAIPLAPAGPLPIAYLRDPITGSLTPVYDQVIAATSENIVMPEELPAFRSSAELVEAGWQEGSGLLHELQAGSHGKPLPELPGSAYR
ncbi:hypothetical protein TWF696_003784 [Orbilia brochopaga]|uniref:Kelch repeat-containing protein n=1 Tax=Orbilia brochopaga TaxID=3140254 RepID=A0AAV9V4T0_9PEZI